LFRSLVLKKQDDIEQKRKLNCLILLGPAIKQVWKELSFCHKLNFLSPISTQSRSVNLFLFPFYSYSLFFLPSLSQDVLFHIPNLSIILLSPHLSSLTLSWFSLLISLHYFSSNSFFSSTPLVASPLLFILSYFLHSVSLLILSLLFSYYTIFQRILTLFFQYI